MSIGKANFFMIFRKKRRAKTGDASIFWKRAIFAMFVRRTYRTWKIKSVTIAYFRCMGIVTVFFYLSSMPAVTAEPAIGRERGQNECLCTPVWSIKREIDPELPFQSLLVRIHSVRANFLACVDLPARMNPAPNVNPPAHVNSSCL